MSNTAIFDFSQYAFNCVLTGAPTTMHVPETTRMPYSRMHLTPVFMVYCGNKGISVHYTREGAERARNELLKQRRMYAGELLQYKIKETYKEKLRLKYDIKP